MKAGTALQLLTIKDLSLRDIGLFDRILVLDHGL
jgi:hypothetical protein